MILGPGEGERVAIGPAESVIKATGEDTGGSFFLQESVVPPGMPGPPPHVHERMHDMFYVLEGTLTVRLGDATRELGPGSFVCAAPGEVHTFSNRSDQPVRLLNFSTPSGWEGYMRELSRAVASGEAGPEVFADLAARHDLRIEDRGQPG